MKISDKTISALAKIITGDSGISPYKSGPKLVDFFNDIGADDVYGKGFPSRWSYAEEKLRQFNNTPKLAKIFNNLLDPRDFMQTNFEVLTVVNTLN
jgi:hypothetical protein